MTGFTVQKIEALDLEGSASVLKMFTLSPCVWREANQYALLLRLVPHSDKAGKISRIYAGSSDDGLRFTVDAQPVIAPDSGADDRDGCEDPTVALTEHGTFVYYSGWNGAEETGRLLLASGPDSRKLQKHGIMLAPMDGHENPKEATLVQVPDGSWRLFFEYADDGASKIGLASGPAVDGPWTLLPSPVEARSDHWDSYHLSPGPVSDMDPKRPVMFYNGADEETRWRIGWIVFDENYTRILERSDAPLIVPPPGQPGDTDIAFAASSVAENGIVYLYYSIADKDLFRAALEPR